MHQCLVTSLLETGRFGLVDWLVVPTHGLTNWAIFSALACFPLWILQLLWDTMERTNWGLIFFYKWLLEDPWGPTLASPSFKDSEKQCCFHTPWCSMAVSCVCPRSGGLKLKLYLLWSTWRCCLWESSGTPLPAPIPKLQTRFPDSMIPPQILLQATVFLWRLRGGYLLELEIPEFLYAKPNSWEIRVQPPLLA